MELIEAEELTEFEAILRRHRLTLAEFSLSATDTTDPKTDEVQALQGELTVRRASSGQNRQYLIIDSTSWLERFRHDIESGAFIAQDTQEACAPAARSK